jgi:hypothetical protein
MHSHPGPTHRRRLQTGHPHRGCQRRSSCRLAAGSQSPKVTHLTPLAHLRPLPPALAFCPCRRPAAPALPRWYCLGLLYCSSIVPLLFLYCSSCSFPLALLPPTLPRSHFCLSPVSPRCQLAAFNRRFPPPSSYTLHSPTSSRPAMPVSQARSPAFSSRKADWKAAAPVRRD